MNPIYRLRSVLVFIVLSLLVGGGVTAHAAMLPMIVEHTQQGEQNYWWSVTEPEISGVLDRAIFSKDAHGIVPLDARTNFRVSRVFQRPDIGELNAQKLASMAGATTFFLGDAYMTTVRVKWLSSTAASIRIEGTLYDTRSGAKIADLQVTGYGVSGNRAQALAVAADAVAPDLWNFQPQSSRAARGREGLQVVVRVTNGAQTYTDIVDALNAQVGDAGRFSPCRASGGAVVLCLVDASKGVKTNTDELAQRLMRGLQRALPPAVLDRVTYHQGRIDIVSNGPASPASLSESPRL